MKHIEKTLVLIALLAAVTGPVNAKTYWDGLNDVAPRSNIFDQLNAVAPRSDVFDQLNAVAPRSDVFEDLSRAAP